MPRPGEVAINGLDETLADVDLELGGALPAEHAPGLPGTAPVKAGIGTGGGSSRSPAYPEK
jgi:hypothetical protein